jgi:hypothetical protein
MKTKPFKTTFYFGLILIFFISCLVSLIVVNVSRSTFFKLKKEKITDTMMISLPPEIQIIHDTVYRDREVIPKKIPKVYTPKITPIIEEKDSSIIK